MIEFVTSVSIEVISCFEVKPRRKPRLSDVTYKAFRLCIPEADRCKLLNADIWPAYVSISEWFFKQKSLDAKDQAALNPSDPQTIGPEANLNLDMEETVLTCPTTITDENCHV
jgi:hypothetical protein